MDQYAKSFTKPSIRIGTITVLLAMLGSFFPNIYLYLAYGVWPDASHDHYGLHDRFFHSRQLGVRKNRLV